MDLDPRLREHMKVGRGNRQGAQNVGSGTFAGISLVAWMPLTGEPLPVL